MKATMTDLRRRLGGILAALERNEPVTISKRGREIAEIIPTQGIKHPLPIKENPAFGLWKDRPETQDPSHYVRQTRKGRVGNF